MKPFKKTIIFWLLFAMIDAINAKHFVNIYNKGNHVNNLELVFTVKYHGDNILKPHTVTLFSPLQNVNQMLPLLDETIIQIVYLTTAYVNGQYCGESRYPNPTKIEIVDADFGQHHCIIGYRDHTDV